MSKLLDIFKFIWNGFLTCLTWIASGVGAIVAAIIGIAASVSNLVSQLTTSTSTVDGLTSFLDPSLSAIADIFSEFPDIVKLGCYCLSIDVMFDSLLGILAVLFSLSVVLATFFFVSVPVWLVGFYVSKLMAVGLVSAFPRGWCPNILLQLASADVYRPMRLSDINIHG